MVPDLPEIFDVDSYTLHSDGNTMKSVQVTGRGRAEIVTQSKPKLKPGYALVRTSHVSLCGSDIRMLYHCDESLYPFPPGTTGHEMVGVVEEVTDASLPFGVGDRVLALAPDHRAMCEYYLAPIDLILPLPNGIPIEVLLQAQQFGTVLYAAKLLPNVIGKSVVVIGQGSAGLWFNFVLRRMGASRVIAVEQDSARLGLCSQFGATHTILNSPVDPREPQRADGSGGGMHAPEAKCPAAEQLKEILSGELADIVIEAAGEQDSINLAIRLVRKFGEILYFGYPRGQQFNIDFERFFHQCCRATTIVGATEEKDQNCTRMAIDLIAQDSSLARSLITHRLKFDQALEAYEMHRTRRDGALKIVIEMPGAVE